MSNVLFLAVKKSPGARTEANRDLRDASRVATEAAAQLLTAAEGLAANMDRLGDFVDPIGNLGEASRKQTDDDREALKASIGELRRKISALK